MDFAVPQDLSSFLKCPRFINYVLSCHGQGMLSVLAPAILNVSHAALYCFCCFSWFLYTVFHRAKTIGVEAKGVVEFSMDKLAEAPACFTPVDIVRVPVTMGELEW